MFLHFFCFRADMRQHLLQHRAFLHVCPGRTKFHWRAQVAHR